MEKYLNIQMSDLYGQYLKIRDEVDEAIREVIRTSVFIKGGKVSDFERKLGDYLHTTVISCANGTDALQLAFMALDFKPGDEVITTPFTFIATVEVLVLLGLKPVFADVCADNFNLDVSRVEEVITARTRAIQPVHLFGQNADMGSILRIAAKHDLVIVEDAAQSLGADYLAGDGAAKKSGTMGLIGCTSFFPSKNLGAFGDGGALFTGNPDLAAKIRSIANHGMKVRYHYERIGVNSRLDSIQAAILEVKLKHLNEYIRERQKVASWYDENLSGIGDISVPGRVPYSTHSFHQYTIRTQKRDTLQQYLKERGIPSMVYYPKPIHLQEAYQYLGYRKGDFPVSEELCETVLSLPIHTEMEQEQLEYITSSIREFYITAKA